MSTSEEIRQNRVEKREKLKKLGLYPYPISIQRTHEIETILNDFDNFLEKEIILVGRIKTMRTHGALTFFDF